MPQVPRSGSVAEDRELAKLAAILFGLESELASRELEFATRHAELQVFEARYFAIVGIRLAHVDRLLAELAACIAAVHPKDASAQAAAKVAAERSQKTEDTLRAEASKPASNYQPSEALKKLYRETARLVHPDLGSDDEDRARRDLAMRALNDAYERGDAAAMHRVLDEFKAGSISSLSKHREPRSTDLKAKIDNVNLRLLKISNDLRAMEESELHQLFRKADVANGRGQSLLELMATELDEEIARITKQVDRYEHS